MIFPLQVTQVWTVPAAAGPAARDLSTVAHGYASTVDPVADYYSGLVGISMIGRPGTLRTGGQVIAADCNGRKICHWPCIEIAVILVQDQ